MSLRSLFLLISTTLLTFSALSGAVYTSQVAEYNGPFEDPSDSSIMYPLGSVLIGNFSFSIPTNQKLIGATVFGTFGNLDSENTTALSTYAVNGITVANCASTNDPCFSNDISLTPVAWTYKFTTAQLASLTGNTVNFSVIQNGAFSVQTGITELDLTTASTPEPGTLVLFGTAGLSLLAAFRRTRRVLVAFAVACPLALEAQVTWSSVSAPVQSTIAGGPFTLSQGGPFTGPVAYCSGGVPLNNAPGVVNVMQPFYFPFVTGRGANLQGYFDYRPRNINEATVAANSTDGGKTWRFQQKVEQLTAACPTSDVNGSGNDAGQGHPFVLNFGGASWLYLLDRRGGHLDSDGLLVHRLTPRAGTPVNPLPENAFTLPPMSSTITRWDFNNDANNGNGVNNSPAPTIGSGTATPLGMTNNYTYSTTPVTVGSIASSDITSTAGSSDTGGNSWRIRGISGTAGVPGNGNGWNTAAPQYSQGAEFDASTAGYSNIVFQYDWYSTNQGVRDLQAQYTVDGTNWTNVGPVQIASPSAYNNQITINFPALGITSVNNNPHFGVRLVSAYDPTYNGPGAPTYTAATLAANGSPVVINNNSGNWRFDEVNVLAGAALPDAPVNTTGLINPDGILAAVPGSFPRQVLYIDKTLSGDLSLPAAQQCGLTPSGKAANHDTDQVRRAQTSDGIHFTDLGPVNGLNDITTTSYSGVRYMAPNGTLLKLSTGNYGLFYGGGNCLDGDSDGFHAILYAESSDLVNWTIVNGMTNPIASVTTVTATDPMSNQTVTIPSTTPVLGATQPWFAGRVYNPNATVNTSNTINLIFAGYNAGYSTDLSSYRTIGQAVLTSGATTLP